MGSPQILGSSTLVKKRCALHHPLGLHADFIKPLCSHKREESLPSSGSHFASQYSVEGSHVRFGVNPRRMTFTNPLGGLGCPPGSHVPGWDWG